jgi:hypothetical protein
MRVGFILCAGAAPLLIAATAQPVRLQPSSPWDVDYAANSCRLIRTFGEGKMVVKLAFESDAPGSMDMLALGTPLQTSEQRVFARLLPLGGKPFEGNVATTVPKRDPAILWSNVPMLPDGADAKFEKEADELKRHPGVRPPATSVADLESRRALRQKFATATTELEIAARRNRPVILEMGSLGEAIAAFDKCSDDSLKDWGVDPQLEAKIARPVWALNPSHWLSSADYPRDMLRKGSESEVNVRLLIDASGHITKCTSLSHYEAPEFSRISCEKITKRARFEPAELADGTKVPSYYIQRVVFRIAPF